MSSEKEKVIRITAKDDASANILTIARAFRTMSTVMRQSIAMTAALMTIQTAERVSVAGLIASYRTLAIVKALATGFTLVGGLIAMVGIMAALQAGSGLIPVSQTARGGLPRQVSRTGTALVHAGETISKGVQGAGGKSGGNINITIHSAQMSYRAGIEETAAELGTLIYQAYRRLRH